MIEGILTPDTLVTVGGYIAAVAGIGYGFMQKRFANISQSEASFILEEVYESIEDGTITNDEKLEFIKILISAMLTDIEEE